LSVEKAAAVVVAQTNGKKKNSPKESFKPGAKGSPPEAAPQVQVLGDLDETTRQANLLKLMNKLNKPSKIDAAA